MEQIAVEVEIVPNPFVAECSAIAHVSFIVLALSALCLILLGFALGQMASASAGSRSHWISWNGDDSFILQVNAPEGKASRPVVKLQQCFGKPGEPGGLLASEDVAVLTV